jgi:hypothetical protein
MIATCNYHETASLLPIWSNYIVTHNNGDRSHKCCVEWKKLDKIEKIMVYYKIHLNTVQNQAKLID